MKQSNIQEKVDYISLELEKHKANPVKALYGEELGIAKLVRDGRTFRIFVKEVQAAKSGKAMLVEMKVFVNVNNVPFAVVRGHTYLPNFVLENNDVYWILLLKIHGKLGDAEDFSIDKQYIPKEFNTYGNFWSSEITDNYTPERQADNYVKMMEKMKESFEQDLRLEEGVLAFMAVVA